jgi:hypothetical protein
MVSVVVVVATTVLLSASDVITSVLLGASVSADNVPLSTSIWSIALLRDTDLRQRCSSMMPDKAGIPFVNLSGTYIKGHFAKVAKRSNAGTVGRNRIGKGHE